MRLIKYSENLINFASDVKSTPARGRELIKGHFTRVILSPRARQGEVCDPREFCAATPHPKGWKSKERQGGGRGWAQTHRHTAGHWRSAGQEAKPASKILSVRRQRWRKEKRKPPDRDTDKKAELLLCLVTFSLCLFFTTL